MRWEEKFLQKIEMTSNNCIDIKETEIGKIISIEPLQIDLKGLPLFKENLYINSSLLEHTREFNTLSGTAGDGTITISNGSIYFKSSLNIGDLVSLRSMGNKKYLVMSRIVRGDELG